MGAPTLGPLEDTCRRVGASIGAVLDDHAVQNPESPRVGFALLMFTFGEGGGRDWMTYISNAERESMTAALREMLDRLATSGEGR